MNRLYFFLVTVFILSFGTLSAQNKNVIENKGTFSSDRIVPENFDNELFQTLIINKVNHLLDSLGLEGFEKNDFFTLIAKKHSDEMAKSPDETAEVEAKVIKERLIAGGGSGVGGEIIAKITIRISNEYITYDMLADQVVSRWSSGKNYKELISQKYFFAGVSANIEKLAKKIFVSMFMGNYNSFKTPSVVKAKGMKPYDEKFCVKATSKIPDIINMQQGLSIDNNNIIFAYDNLKGFKKLIKEKKDGIAVGVVDETKYEDCSSQNVPSNETMVSVGFPTKPLFTKKLYKNNIAEGEGKRNKITKLKLNLGPLPAQYANNSDIELNLMIIKNKIVCEDIPMTFVDKKIYENVPKITILPDTVELPGAGRYVPTATSTELKFNVPFERAKYTYNPEDMKPALEALNEPDFIINKILIEAASSLEGNEKINKELSKKRAQSIVKALIDNQNASIVDSIVTKDSWEEMKLAVVGTVYEDIAKMKYDEALKYVNEHIEEMEIILAQQRYAAITIWVTYNTEGEKEQKYVLNQFNRAVEAQNYVLALSIQKYIMKRVIDGIYTDNAITDMKIPQTKECVGLNMNKIWLYQYVYMEALDEEYMDKIEALNKLDNKNIYVEYNDIVCKIAFKNLFDEKLQDNLQRRIDKLYNTSISVNLVDLLNIEFQCQIINAYKDSVGYGNPITMKFLTKLKEIIHADELKWENALKMATIFISHNDYKYAAYLLEPWVLKDNAPVQLLETYFTVCTKIPNKYLSNNFATVAKKLQETDKAFFCNLFKDNKLSKQIFTNLKVKDIYCKSCIK